MSTFDPEPASVPTPRAVTCVSPRRPRRRLVALVLVASVLALAVLPAAAQGPSGDPASTERDERDRARVRADEVGEELDALTASDVELKAELARLDARVDELEAAAAEATAEQERIEGELGDLRRQVTEAEEQVAVARAVAADRAVSAYMRPERESATQMLAAEDPQTLGRMNTLIRHVGLHDHSVMVNRQMAEFELEASRNELEQARTRIDELAAQSAADLAQAEDMRARQDEVRVQLEVRIDELRSESQALQAQEANLTSLILQREVAATSTTTTTAPASTSTTVAAAAPTTAAPAPGQPPAPPTTSGPRPTSPPPTSPPPTTRPPAGGTLSWPASGPVTSPYGPRWGTFHRGIDIGAPMGAPIRAADSGTVFFSGEMGGYGLVVLIDHGNGIVTLYAHQSQLQASNGQFVSRGSTIGLIGSTGNSTGPHLHFEVRLGSSGNAVDPMGYLG